jgi:hypothetical protein
MVEVGVGVGARNADAAGRLGGGAPARIHSRMLSMSAADKCPPINGMGLP